MKQIGDKINDMCALLDFDINYKGRKADKIIKKHIMIWSLRKDGYSLSRVAGLFGLNHSSVIHCVNKIDNLLFVNDIEVLEYISLLNKNL